MVAHLDAYGAHQSPFRNWLDKAQAETDADAVLVDVTKALEVWQISDGGREKAVALRLRAFVSAIKGSFQPALNDLSEAIRLDPTSTEAYYNRGRIYSQLGELKKAVSDYTVAIEGKRDFWQAYGNRGNALTRLEQYDAALEDYAALLRLKPQERAALEGRAEVHKHLDDWELAAKDYDQLLQEFPQDVKLHLLRALVFFRQGDTLRALEDCDRVLALDRRNADALELRGSIRCRLGEFRKGIEDYERIEPLGRFVSAVPRVRIAALVGKGDLSGSIREATQLIEKYPQDAVAFGLRGWAFRMKGEYEHSVADLERSESLNPRDADLALQLAATYDMMGDLDKALAEIRRGMALKGSEQTVRDLHILRVGVLRERGSQPETDRAVAEALKYLKDQWGRAPMRPASCVALAEFYGEADLEPIEAFRLAKIALAKMGGPSCWYVSGVCQWRRGRLKSAIFAIEHALEKRPAESLWRWRLGCLYREDGDMKRARAAWEAGLKVDPRNRFILKELGKSQPPAAR
jgi:tetratricopeptide (TPR) repeat protein